MSRLRKDPTRNGWVVLAEERAKRPHDFKPHGPPEEGRSPSCPFCAGNESETPNEWASYREPGTLANKPGWRVRAVPNKYPALLETLPFQRDPEIQNGEYDERPGFGVHEVILEAPDHRVLASEFTPDEIGEIFRMYRDRLAARAQDDRLAYVQIFKNVGAAAGASLEHAHSQLLGMSLIPPRLQEEYDRANDYFKARATCIYCDMIAEARSGVRFVAEENGFIAICPFAPRFPFETWILPTAHADHFELSDDATCLAVGRLTQRVLAAIERVIALIKTSPSTLAAWAGASGSGSGTPAPELAPDAFDTVEIAYNYVLHGSPFRTPTSPAYHWHLEIFPAIVHAAGFEWATGIHINPVPPEKAAACLKRLLAEGI